MTITEELEKENEKIKKTSQELDRSKNAELQRQINNDFAQNVDYICNEVDEIVNAKKITSFVPNEDIIQEIEGTLDALSGFDDDTPAGANDIKKLGKEITQIHEEMDSLWSDFYNIKTGQTISMLRVLEKVNPQKTRLCIDKIESGKKWSGTYSNKERMEEGLKNANEIITSLNVNSEIVDFLQKMNRKEATLQDIDEKILEWIRDNELEKNICLSFT